MFHFAFKNIRGHLRFYVPFLLILVVLTFVFSTLLALALGSSQIYQRSGSKDLLAVFESNRACVMASLVPEVYKSRIEGLPHIEDITGEVRHIIVYGPKKSLTIAGVEPGKFREFKSIKISDGAYEAFMKDPQGVIIGKKVQRIFQWQIGEQVNFQGMTFNIRGVFTLPMSVYDGMIVFHKDYMQKLVSKEGFFTAITIRIDDPENKSAVSKAVEQLFADHPAGISCRSEAEFWGMTEKQMGDFGKHMRALVRLCSLILFVVIVNGAVFHFKRRQEETRIWRIVGLTRAKIFALYFIEPLLATVLAGTGGALLAFLVWIKQPMMGGEHAIVPPIAVTPFIVMQSILAVLAIAVIPSVVAAYTSASRMGSQQT
jgi:putative ABC transport system permease protein